MNKMRWVRREGSCALVVDYDHLQSTVMQFLLMISDTSWRTEEEAAIGWKMFWQELSKDSDAAG